MPDASDPTPDDPAALLDDAAAPIAKARALLDGEGAPSFVLSALLRSEMDCREAAGLTRETRRLQGGQAAG